MAQTYLARLKKEYFWDKISTALDEAHEAWKEEIKDSSLVADEIHVEGRFAKNPNELGDIGISVYCGMENYGYEPLVRASIYIGSVFSVYPSGKYYTFWTTNQTAEDVRKDEAFQAAMDKLTERYNIILESGEGDPTDLFFVRYYEYEGAENDRAEISLS